jgi:hypothetical protein
MPATAIGRVMLPSLGATVAEIVVDASTRDALRMLMRIAVATLALSAACGEPTDTKNEISGSAAAAGTPTATEAAKPPTPVAPAPAGRPVDVTGRQL